MTKQEANKIAKEVGTILDADCTVYYFDDETLYINTGEDSLSFDLLLLVREHYNIEAVNIDDDCEGYIILQIDLRSDEDRRADDEIGEELLKQSDFD